MGEHHKKEIVVTDPAVAEKVAQAKSEDPASRKLTRRANAIGNEEVQRQLQESGTKRDELLKGIGARLAVMRKVQLDEIKLAHNRSVWKGNVASGSWSKPEPNRWREPAKLYEEAAHALAHGTIARGKEILTRAAAAEQHAFEALTELIEIPENEYEAILAGLSEIGDGSCAPTDLPPEIELARLIRNVEIDVEDAYIGPREADPWWTEEEDDEEEKPDGAGA